MYYEAAFCLLITVYACVRMYRGKRTHAMDPTIARAWAHHTRTHSARTHVPTPTPMGTTMYTPTPMGTPTRVYDHTHEDM